MERFLNRVWATLASGIDAATTTLPLTAGHGARFGTIPAGDKVRIVFLDAANNVSEVAYVTAISGDNATIVRGQDGTVGVAHLAGDRIEHRIGKSTMEAFDQFPSGTRMLFNQTDAPVGWTKDATASLNNTALRLVTGAVGSGGSQAFTTSFGGVISGTVNSGGAGTSGATTLTASQIPSHGHYLWVQTLTRQDTWNEPLATGDGNGVTGEDTGTTGWVTDKIQNTGGGGSHTHTTPNHTHTFTGTTNLAVKYVDVIIASKD